MVLLDAVEFEISMHTLQIVFKIGLFRQKSHIFKFFHSQSLCFFVLCFLKLLGFSKKVVQSQSYQAKQSENFNVNALIFGISIADIRKIFYGEYLKKIMSVSRKFNVLACSAYYPTICQNRTMYPLVLLKPKQ